uniref:Uncharacterized protein n=1 Tax=Arion vulgaris TaxID=1028688 RepID=A0A0B7BNP9_9EUPU
MDIHGHFEPIYKMNRLGPVSTSTLPPPVKFRTVLYDPKYMEHETTNSDQDSDDDSNLFDTDSALPTDPNGQFFFKDPLQFPDHLPAEKYIRESENKTLSAAKLGKNMRSSDGPVKNGGHTKIFKLMEEGNRLLDLQKEQHILYRKQAASEQMAAVLVNDLLKNGFNITPPDSTPRFVDDAWTSSTSNKLPSVYEDGLKNVEASQLVVAMHKELKRLQTNDADIG